MTFFKNPFSPKTSAHSIKSARKEVLIAKEHKVHRADEVKKEEYQAVLKKIDEDLDGWLREASEYIYSYNTDIYKQVEVNIDAGKILPAEINYPFDMPDFYNKGDYKELHDKHELVKQVFKPKMLVFDMEILCFQTEKTKKAIVGLLAKLENLYSKRQIVDFRSACNKLLCEIDTFIQIEEGMFHIHKLYTMCAHPLIDNPIPGYTPPKLKRVEHGALELKNELQAFIGMIEKANGDVDFASIFLKIRQDENEHAGFSEILEHIDTKKEEIDDKSFICEDMIKRSHITKKMMVEEHSKFLAEQLASLEEKEVGISASEDGSAREELTPEEEALYDKAVGIVTETRKGSISNLQRKLSCGYNIAAHLIEVMESNGIVSPMKSDGSRDVLHRGPFQ